MQSQNSHCSLEDGWKTLLRHHLARIESHVDSMDIRVPLGPIFSPSEFLSGYSVVYSLCIAPENKHEEPLYLRLCQLFADYLKKKVSAEAGTTISAESLVDTWIRYRAYVSSLSDIFSYLDRFYVRWSSKPTLTLKALEIFQSSIFDKHKPMLKCTLLGLLDSRRSTMEVDEVLVGAITQMYHELDGSGGLQYREELEGDIVERALKYYSNMAPLWAKDLNLVDYVSIVEHCMEQERNDCERWLTNSTKKLLMNGISNTMLRDQLETLMPKLEELEPLIQEGNEADMQLVYAILGKVEDCIPKMGDVLMRSVYNANGSSNSVVGILESWTRYQGLLKRCFSDDGSATDQCDTFQSASSSCPSDGTSVGRQNTLSPTDKCSPNLTLLNAVRDAFKGLISNSGDFSKGLVDHWDSIIVNGSDDARIHLMNCSELLDLIGNKNPFLQCYKFKLASRLLYKRSSMYLENMSLSMIEQRCSTDEVLCLRRMIQEIVDYNKSIHTSPIQLLSKANWPCLKDYNEDIKLHEEFERGLSELYATLKSQIHRKVEYNRMLGKVELELGCDSNNSNAKILTCDLAQASALLLIDDINSSIEDLSAKLNVSMASLQSILQPLVEKDVVHISEGGFVQINRSFANGIDVTVNAVPEYSNAGHSTDAGNVLDTSSTIDSSIMTLLKRAKSMKTEELLLQLSRFSREEVLNRIKNLHQREYVSIADDMICYIP